MRRIYLLLLLTTLIVSCNQKPVSNKLSKVCSDTLMINGKMYCLDSISESLYNSIIYKYPLETDTIAIDTSFIKMSKDSILIKTNEKLVSLKNDTSNSSSYVKYKYLKTYNNIGYVHLKALCYEWTEDVLVSLKDGKLTSLFNKPIVSPNKKLLLSYNVDLIAGFMPNGIELYKIMDGRLESIFVKEISSWGPEEIKWESDTSIVIKRKKVDFASNNFQEHFDFRRMIIK